MQRILPRQRPSRLALAASFFFVQAGFKLDLLPDLVTCETLEMAKKKGVQAGAGGEVLSSAIPLACNDLKYLFYNF